MVYQIGQAAIDAEDHAFATKKAKQFMRVLFGGDMLVRCTCGNKIKFKKNRLFCEACEMKMNRVEYEDEYDDKIIKTVIDVDKKEFTLEQMDFDG